MQRIVHFMLGLMLAGQIMSACGAAGAAPSDLRLVAYGVLKKQDSGPDAGRYLLVDNRGQATYWISPAGNLPLDTHLGKQVEVVGKVDSARLSEKQLVVETVIPTKTAPPAHFVEVQRLAAEELAPIPKSAIRPESKPAPLVRSKPAIVSEPPLLEGPELLDPGTAEPLTLDPRPQVNPWHVAPCGPPEKIWARSEYLLWWTKGLQLPPLVTTSPLSVLPQDAGVLGLDGTETLFGNENLFTENRSGTRLQLGGWLGPRRWIGWDVEYAVLKDAETGYSAGSYDVPILARPFFNQGPTAADRGPDALLVVYPNQFDGNVSVQVFSEFRTGAAHLIGNLWCNQGSTGDAELDLTRNNGFRVDWISGYRYLKLHEGVLIHQNLIRQVTPRAGLTLDDQFVTANEFQGGELGLQGKYRRGPWWLEGLVKLAVGRTKEQVNIHGTTHYIEPPLVDSVPGVAVTPSDPGALLAQVSNIGDRSRDQFALLPEFGVTIGYKLNPQLSATVGYSLLYLNHVVRPGNTLDLNVNTAYMPPDTNSSSRPRVPAFAFSDSDFWAQGFSFGVDFRW